MKILVVAPFCPYPPKNGGAVRIYNLLRQMSQDHEVTLIYTTDEADEPIPMNVIADKLGVKRVLPIIRSRENTLAVPRSFRSYYSNSLRRTIKELDQDYNFDVIQVEYTQMAYAIDSRLRHKSLLVEHDITFVTLFRKARTKDSFTDKLKVLYSCSFFFVAELFFWHHFHCVVCMSDHDARLVKRLVSKANVQIVPNATLVPKIPKFRMGEQNEFNLIFVGNFEHEPNRDGIHYFLQAVYPELKRLIPRTKLTIVGHPTPDVIDCHSPAEGIFVVGYVQDMEQIYTFASVVIIPIRVGSGTRLKVLDAFSHGLPVVSTSIGVEGLMVKNGVHLMIADSPAEMVKCLQHLSQNLEYGQLLGNNARDLVQSLYTWEKSYNTLQTVYNQTINSGRKHDFKPE